MSLVLKQYGLVFGSPCPCGSGQQVQACCLRGDHFHRDQAATAPPLPRTGHARGGCYASPLSDCSSKLSAEHYVSKAILDLLNAPTPSGSGKPKDLRVKGLHWIPDGEERCIPPDALKAKVLCTRHNSALSGLDAMAAQFFLALDAIDEEFGPREAEAAERVRVFNGHDVERWLLKMTCGLAASGCVDHGWVKPTDSDIPQEWLHVLFGDTEFGPMQGLYVPVEIGRRYQGTRGIHISVLGRNTDEGGKLAGLGVQVRTYPFVFSMSPRPSDPRLIQGVRHAFRPDEIEVTCSGEVRSIVLTWDGPHDGGKLTFTAEAAT